MPAVFCLMVGFLFVLVVASWPKKVRKELKVEVIKPEAVSTSDRIFSGFARDIANMQRDAGILELDYRQMEQDFNAVVRSVVSQLGEPPGSQPEANRLLNGHLLPEDQSTAWLPPAPPPKAKKKKKPPVVHEVDASIPPRLLDRRSQNPTAGCSIEEGGPDVYS